jgi:hypothetical protein
MESYGLLVAPKAGLCQIRSISREIPTNRQGVELRAEYATLKEQLESVYGAGDETDRLLPGSLWDGVGEWMTALLKKERVLFTQWSTQTGANLRNGVARITVAARASSEEMGRVYLQYDLANYRDCSEELKAAQAGVL